MAPTIKNIYNEAWKPYTTQTARKPMSFEQMYNKAIVPLREFMFKQLDRRGDDLSGIVDVINSNYKKIGGRQCAY